MILKKMSLQGWVAAISFSGKEKTLASAHFLNVERKDNPYFSGHWGQSGGTTTRSYFGQQRKPQNDKAHVCLLSHLKIVHLVTFINLKRLITFFFNLKILINYQIFLIQTKEKNKKACGPSKTLIKRMMLIEKLF